MTALSRLASNHVFHSGEQQSIAGTAMLAFAMMAAIRHRANAAPVLKKTRPPPRPKHRS